MDDPKFQDLEDAIRTNKHKLWKQMNDQMKLEKEARRKKID